VCKKQGARVAQRLRPAAAAQPAVRCEESTVCTRMLRHVTACR
jgi:hypothetical protein